MAASFLGLSSAGNRPPLSPIVSPSLWFLLWIQRYNHRAAVENQSGEGVSPPPTNFLAICPQRLHPLGTFVWFQLAIGTHLAPKHFGLCSRPYDLLSVGLRIVSIDVAAASSVLSNK